MLLSTEFAVKLALGRFLQWTAYRCNTASGRAFVKS